MWQRRSSDSPQEIDPLLDVCADRQRTCNRRPRATTVKKVKRLAAALFCGALAISLGGPISGAAAAQSADGSAGQVANNLLDQAAAVFTQGYSDGDINSCALSGSTSINRILIQNSSSQAQKITYSMDAGTAQTSSITLAREDLDCNAIGGGGNESGGDFLVPPSSTAAIYVTAGGTARGCSGLEDPGCNLYFALNGSSGRVTLDLSLTLLNGFKNWTANPASTNTGMGLGDCLTTNGSDGSATAVGQPGQQGQVGDGSTFGGGQTICMNIASNAEANGNSGTIPTKYEFPSVFFGSFGAGNVYNVQVEGGLPTCDAGTGPNSIATDINYVGPSGQVWSDPGNSWLSLDGGSLQVAATGDDAWPFSVKLLNAAGAELRYNVIGGKGSWITEPSGGWSSGEQAFSAQGNIYSVSAPSPYGAWADDPLAPSRAPYNWIYISSDNHAHYFAPFADSEVAQQSPKGTSANYSYVPMAGTDMGAYPATAFNDCAQNNTDASAQNPVATVLADYTTPVDYAATAPWAKSYSFSPNSSYSSDSVVSNSETQTYNAIKALSN